LGRGRPRRSGVALGRGDFRAWVVLPEPRGLARAADSDIMSEFFLRVEKFKAELHCVLAYVRRPARSRQRVRTTNLAESFFRHRRRYLGCFLGCVGPVHSEQVLGCFILACEQAHT